MSAELVVGKMTSIVHQFAVDVLPISQSQTEVAAGERGRKGREGKKSTVDGQVTEFALETHSTRSTFSESGWRKDKLLPGLAACSVA